MQRFGREMAERHHRSRELEREPDAPLLVRAPGETRGVPAGPVLGTMRAAARRGVSSLGPASSASTLAPSASSRSAGSDAGSESDAAAAIASPLSSTASELGSAALSS